MPGQHCSRCGAARGAAGCACPPAPNPDLTETAVLPHIEGPPLVRPYVRGPVQYDGPPTAYASTPAQDAFATTLMPPVPAPVPAQAPGPGPTPAAGHVPPPPVHAPARVPAPRQAPWIPEDAEDSEPPQEAGAELGIFAFQQPQPPGGRAERRNRRQVSAGRRRTVVLAAGTGIAAIGVGLAFVLAPSSDGKDHAMPLPTGRAQPSASESPSATPSESPSPSASPSGTVTSKPPTTRPAVAAISRSAKPSPTPSTSTPTPSPSATGPRVLQLHDTGADVSELQSRLRAAGYRKVGPPGTFDDKTQADVADFQSWMGINEEPGVYGPQTRAALEAYTS